MDTTMPDELTWGAKVNPFLTGWSPQKDERLGWLHNVDGHIIRCFLARRCGEGVRFCLE
jgi:hypothetical protein